MFFDDGLFCQNKGIVTFGLIKDLAGNEYGITWKIPITSGYVICDITKFRVKCAYNL